MVSIEWRIWIFTHLFIFFTNMYGTPIMYEYWVMMENTEANCFSVWDIKREKDLQQSSCSSAGSGRYWSRWLTNETLQSITQCLKSVTTSCIELWSRLPDTIWKITTNTIQPELLTLVTGFSLQIFKDKITSHILDINSCMNCSTKQAWSRTATKFSHNS